MLISPNQLIQRLRNTDKLQKITLFSIYAIPVLALSVRHWLSGLYTFLILVGLVTLRRNIRPLYKEEKILFILFLLFIASFFLSATLNDWSPNSIRRVGNVMKYVFFFPFYLLLRQYSSSKLLITSMYAACFVVGVHALYDINFTSLGQAWGIYGPIPFGDISLLYLGFILTLTLFNRDGSRQLYLYLPALLFAAVAVILSGSRNAWLAAAYSIVLVPLLSLKYLKYRKQILVIIPIVIVGIIGFMLAGNMQDRLALGFKEFQSFVTEGAQKSEQLRSNSVGFRLEQWRAVLMLNKEKPWFGYGGGNAGKHVSELARKGIVHPDLNNPDTERGIGGVHSTYFEKLMNEGRIGLIIILAFLFYPLYIFIRARSTNPLLSTLGILFITSYMIFGITENPFVHDNFSAMYLLVLAILFSQVIREKYQVDEPADLSVR